jgi:hypothetical protein
MKLSTFGLVATIAAGALPALLLRADEVVQ